MSDLVIAVCTRNRAEQLHDTLDRLLALDGPPVPMLVVDQSDHGDRRLAGRAAADPRLDILRDGGRGLSRARNLAVGATQEAWIVFVDDDCRLEADWACGLVELVQRHPDADFVSGQVLATRRDDADYLAVTTFEVDRERRIAGARVRPWEIGFGVCMAVRRAAIERLDGWDERLGPGAPDFPAADDMDFNWRLLRSGGVAYVTPRLRAFHEQWRSPRELGPLYAGYMSAWMGFSMKHLRGGELRDGIWLWSLGLRDMVRMFASAGRRRSRLRLYVALHKLRGLVSGTAKGALRRW